MLFLPYADIQTPCELRGWSNSSRMYATIITECFVCGPVAALVLYTSLPWNPRYRIAFRLTRGHRYLEFFK